MEPKIQQKPVDPFLTRKWDDNSTTKYKFKVFISVDTKDILLENSTSPSSIPLDLKHTLSIFEVRSGFQLFTFNYRLQEHKRGYDPPETSPMFFPSTPSFQVEISSGKPKEARLICTNKSHSAGRPYLRVRGGGLLTISHARAITATFPIYIVLS